jgi:hypothetical protein
MDDGRTLYVSVDGARFFVVDDDAELLPGSFEIRSLQGRARTVDPVVLDVWEVTEAEGRARAEREVEEMIAGAKRFMSGLVTVARQAKRGEETQGPVATSSGKEPGFRETLGLEGQDPDAAIAALKEAVSGLGSILTEAVSPSPQDQAHLAGRLHALGDLLREQGAVDAADRLEAAPEAMRKALLDPETQRHLRDAADRLADLDKLVKDVEKKGQGGTQN